MSAKRSMRVGSWREEKLRQQFSEFTDDEFRLILNGAYLSAFGESYDDVDARVTAEDAEMELARSTDAG